MSDNDRMTWPMTPHTPTERAQETCSQATQWNSNMDEAPRDGEQLIGISDDLAVFAFAWEEDPDGEWDNGWYHSEHETQMVYPVWWIRRPPQEME